MLEYEELRIRIWKSGTNRYLVFANGPAAGTAAIHLDKLPQAYWQDLNELLQEDFGRLSTSREQTTKERGEQLGRELLDTFLAEAVRDCFDKCLELAHRESRGLRLRFDVCPELMDIPFELLHSAPQDPLGAVALKPTISVARSIYGLTLPKPRLPQPDEEHAPMPLLVIAPTPPDGSEPLDVQGEVNRLRQVLPDLLRPFEAEILHFLGWPDSSPRATTQNIDRFFVENTPCAVLLIAHGEYSDDQKEVFISLDGKSGDPEKISSQNFAGLLATIPGLRLALLNICFGGKSIPDQPFSGLGEALLAEGVPAVVAMQTEVSDEAAVAFSSAFFGAIYRNQSVDEAVSAGRRAMASTQRTRIEWCNPVLLLHRECGDSWLFKVPELMEDNEDMSDHVREGFEIIERTRTAPRVQDFYSAARFHRRREEWKGVIHYANALLDRKTSKAAEYRRLLLESKTELQIENCHKICNLLAQERNPQRAMELLPALKRVIDPCFYERLKTEISEAAQLERIYINAAGAEEQEEWDYAMKLLEEIRQLRSHGYRDSQVRREILAAMAKEAWAQVEELCEKSLRRRPDDKATSAKRHYAQGRIAEAAEDWAEAISAYKSVAQDDYRDLRERLTYAQGRTAEDSANWQKACEAYEQLAADHLDVRQRLPYARGRAAEKIDEWENAVGFYKSVQGYADAAERLPHAQARAAAKILDWKEVLRTLLPLEKHRDTAVRARWKEEIKGLQQVACQHLDSEVQNAERQGRWQDAYEIYLLLHRKSRKDKGKDRKGITKRRLYAQARSEEEKGDWTKAMAIYSKPSLRSHQDVEQRLRYAQARAAEDQECWDDAVTLYEKLEKDHQDVRERLPYARGRQAEPKENWQGVVDGFGSLPDSYREGDVGLRRRYARGRRDEAKGQWSQVVDALREVPAEYCEGEAGRLRSYAQGRLAEQQEDWASAVAAYADLDAKYRDVAHRREYARGRQAEEHTDWAEAFAAYTALKEASTASKEGSVPEKLRQEVLLRHNYAEGRLAEEREDWQRAVAAYRQLVPNYEDSAGRLAYVRGREAECHQDWQEVLDVLQGLEGAIYSRMLHYAKGRLAERTQDWPLAVEHFTECSTYLDADKRRIRAGGRGKEDAGRWSCALEAYRRVEGPDEELTLRQKRLEELLEVLPWVDGLAAAGLIADPLAARHGDSAYEALAQAGVTPSSPAKDVMNASFVLMERGAMAPEARLAWDQMRSPENRLRIDTFLHRLQDPQSLLEVQKRLEPRAPAEILGALCQALPADEPLFLLLDNRREQAAELWEKRLRSSPQEVSVVHALAVAHFWQAQDLEASGAFEQAERSWELAISHWARLVSEDAYWDEWRQSRANCYQQIVTPSNMARLRSELGQRLLSELARRAEQLRGERTEAYRDLATALEVELEGARALKEVGGLLFGHEGTQSLVCGVLYLRHTAMGERLGRVVAELEAERGEREQPDDLQTALDTALGTGDLNDLTSGIAADTRFRLRCAFSELGRAFLLLRHQPEQAIRALPALYKKRLTELPADCGAFSKTGTVESSHLTGCPHCQDFLSRNPSYLYLPHRRSRLLQDAVALAVRAHLELAQTALTTRRDGLAEAFEQWRCAIAVARNAGTQVRTKRAIVRVVLGRAEALAEHRGRDRGQRLSEAIHLVEQARELIGGAGAGQLSAKEAELLTDRGVWYGNGCQEYEDPDYEQAAQDLRSALNLTPDSLHARDNLCRALIFHAANMYHENGSQKPFKLFAEAIEVLHQGLLRTAGHRQLRGVLLKALDELEEWVLFELTGSELAQRITEPDVSRQAGDEHALNPRHLAAVADQMIGRDDLTGALITLIQATRQTDDPDIRQKLIHTVQQKAGN